MRKYAIQYEERVTLPTMDFMFDGPGVELQLPSKRMFYLYEALFKLNGYELTPDKTEPKANTYPEYLMYTNKKFKVRFYQFRPTDLYTIRLQKI